MKNLLKIILIGIIAAVTYKYLNERGINVNQHLKKVLPVLENLSGKVENLLPELKEPQKSATNYKKPNNECAKEQESDSISIEAEPKTSFQQAKAPIKIQNK